MNERELIERTLQLINQSGCTEEEFNSHALDLFRYQYERNEPFQLYCRSKGRTPRLVKNWKDIPAVPIDAFKGVPLSCHHPDEAAAVFMTSGTTTGNRGKHYHATLEVYDASMRTYFKERFMGELDRISMGILFPTREDLPNSSLSHYLGLANEHFSGGDFQYFVDEEGLRVEPLLAELDRRQQSGEPYALLGASFSFVHLFEEMDKRGLSVRLPEGSKLFDTGGFKNKSAELTPQQFYEQMERFLGVPKERCINMFGMTELSTQLYDNGNAELPSVKSGPHWFRTRVVDPITLLEVPDGDTGVLVHCDLANINSVSTILTEDLGVKSGDGFIFLGRVKGAEAKGCSLALEEFFTVVKGDRT